MQDNKEQLLLLVGPELQQLRRMLLDLAAEYGYRTMVLHIHLDNYGDDPFWVNFMSHPQYISSTGPYGHFKTWEEILPNMLKGCEEVKREQEAKAQKREVGQPEAASALEPNAPVRDGLSSAGQSPVHAEGGDAGLYESPGESLCVGPSGGGENPKESIFSDDQGAYGGVYQEGESGGGGAETEI